MAKQPSPALFGELRKFAGEACTKARHVLIIAEMELTIGSVAYTDGREASCLNDSREHLSS